MRNQPAESSVKAAPEALACARAIGFGARAGFVILVLSFLTYVLGFREALVALDQLPRYWGLPLSQFVKATHSPTGWSWLAHAGNGDMLNLIGISVLAAVPAIGCLAVVPIFARRGEKALIAIALLQVAVLVASACDVFHVSR